MVVKRNVYPNEYVINYTDGNGRKKRKTMRGLTADEAIIRFRSRNMSAKNVAATRKWKTAAKTTLTKVKSAQEMGRYKETSVDKQKKAADFLLLQVSPNVIRWKGGKTEIVTARTLKKLQKTHTWATDF